MTDYQNHTPDSDRIAAALTVALPSHLHAHVPALAQVLADALAGPTPTITDTALLPLLEALRDTPLTLGDRRVTVEAIAGDSINAHQAQGFLNRPSGPVLQVFVNPPPCDTKQDIPSSRRQALPRGIRLLGLCVLILGIVGGGYLLIDLLIGPSIAEALYDRGLRERRDALALYERDETQHTVAAIDAFERSIGTLSWCLWLNGSHGDAAYNRGLNERDLGQLLEATHPAGAQRLYRAAIASHELAITSYTTMYDVDGTDKLAEAYFNLGLSQRSLAVSLDTEPDRHQEVITLYRAAIASHTQALQRDPQHTAARHNKHLAEQDLMQVHNDEQEQTP